MVLQKKLNLQVPDGLMSVMHYYEDTCVMGCCGIAALNLSPQRAVAGIMDHGLLWAERGLVALEVLIQSIDGHSGPVFSNENGFGQKWKSGKQAAIFLGEVKSSLSAAILDAYDFDPIYASHAIAKDGVEWVGHALAELLQIRIDIEALPDGWGVVSSEMNACWSKKEAQDFFGMLAGEITRSLEIGAADPDKPHPRHDPSQRFMR